MMRTLSICVKICWPMWNIRTFRKIKKSLVVLNTPILKRWSGSITSLMVSGHQCRFVVAESVNIWLLPAQYLHFGDGIEIRGTDERRYTSAVEIRDYDSDTEPGQINILMEAPFEFVLTQTYCCMSQQAARTYLTNQQKHYWKQAIHPLRR